MTTFYEIFFLDWHRSFSNDRFWRICKDHGIENVKNLQNTYIPRIFSVKTYFKHASSKSCVNNWDKKPQILTLSSALTTSEAEHGSLEFIHEEKDDAYICVLKNAPRKDSYNCALSVLSEVLW